MKMRAPLVPLITVDPYFSIWSREELNNSFPVHWTGSQNAILGTVTVDGEKFCFLGKSNMPLIKQVSLDINTLSTTAVYENDKITLTAVFTSPMLADDLYYSSRPVSYLKLSYKSRDGKPHSVTAKLSASEELVLNKAGEGRAYSEAAEIDNGTAVRMGSGAQKVLWRDGDDLRIDWGYFYLAVKGEANIGNEVFADLYAVYAETELKDDALFVFAYDDIDSIIHFEKPLKAYWKKDGKTINEAIDEAINEYDTLYQRCEKFSNDLIKAATEKGNEKYAELLSLAYRQVMAAHKLVINEKGENYYISKECFSNGCAATVDVTYPSAPMYLYYNTELLKGMLRPILDLARSELWHFDFAPHDAGRYPILNNQRYFTNRLEGQMPVEECGNMIVLFAAICKKENDLSFAKANMDLLGQWCEYLVKYGEDPENQLCTDDFAGHLAHNCNLSAKAIVALAAYAKLTGETSYGDKAKEMAERWVKDAKADTATRLVFDKEDGWSMKYNMVWDRIFDLGLFGKEVYRGEIAKYTEKMNKYGVPLDSRSTYTKLDWMAWTTVLTDDKKYCDAVYASIRRMVEETTDRVPLTDWYYTDTARQCNFQNRTVLGGFFINLL